MTLHIISIFSKKGVSTVRDNNCKGWMKGPSSHLYLKFQWCRPQAFAIDEICRYPLFLPQVHSRKKNVLYIKKKKSNVYSVASSCPIYFASPKKENKNTPEVLSVACYKRPELGPTA